MVCLKMRILVLFPEHEKKRKNLQVKGDPLSLFKGLLSLCVEGKIQQEGVLHSCLILEIRLEKIKIPMNWF